MKKKKESEFYNCLILTFRRLFLGFCASSSLFNFCVLYHCYFAIKNIDRTRVFATKQVNE